MTGRRRIGWLAAYVLASFFSFPHPIAGGVLDLGMFVGWLAPAFLWLGLEGLPARRAAGLGFLAGWAAHTAILHWIYVVTFHYGEAPFFVGLIAPAGLALYIAAFPALFGAFAGRVPDHPLLRPLGAAALWTALDHLRSFALTGFPWATLGYAQHENALLLPLTTWTGVYGLSFLTVLGGMGALEALRGRGRGLSAVALAGVVVAHVVGGFLARGPDAAQGEPVRIAVVQGNIGQGVKWSPEWADRTLAIYERLSREAAAEGARWILWPETAVPGSVNHSEPTRERLLALAEETGATLVVGAVAIERRDDRPGYRFYDSAFVLDGEAVRGRYDKSHLVPFGEYVPLRALVGRFFQAVARGIADDNVTHGSGPEALEIAVPGRAEPVTAGIPICYELIFPDLVRRFVDDEAGVLLAITNDAWYGRTGAPYQFLAMTAVRSAENRVWTARAANTGVSAFIDARGRVREQTEIFEEGFLVADVPLRTPDERKTYYARHGDHFAKACWLATLAMIVASARRWRRPDGPKEGS